MHPSAVWSVNQMFRRAGGGGGGGPTSGSEDFEAMTVDAYLGNDDWAYMAGGGIYVRAYESRQSAQSINSNMAGAYKWKSQPELADVIVRGKVKLSTNSDHQVGVCARMTGSGATHNGYLLHYYPTGNVRISRFTGSGSSTWLTSALGSGMTYNYWWWIGLKAVGNNLYYQYWRDGDTPTPDSWTFGITDTGAQAAGMMGIYYKTSVASGIYNNWIDEVEWEVVA